MFEKFGGMVKQLQLVQRLMKDENVKALLSHPKVQTFFKDPEFQEIIKTQDMAKLATHPRLASLMRDPDIAPLLAKVDLRQFTELPGLSANG